MSNESDGAALDEAEYVCWQELSALPKDLAVLALDRLRARTLKRRA